MKEVNASIITIGDELLIGQTIDTNSAFIAQELNRIGIWVKRRIAVGDVKDEILASLKEQSKDCDLIIITGGLGPTADDITKPALCEYFNSELVVNEEVLENVKNIFSKFNKQVTERNSKQAEVPDNCIVLPNKRGTAPGMWWGPSPKTGTYVEEGAKAPSRWEGDENSESMVEEETIAYRYADPFIYKVLKDYAVEHRFNPTKAEEVLWELLKTKQLNGYKFRRQHIIDRFIADFVCLKHKLVIEIDGLIHQLPENRASDFERTERLNQIGFEVIRFTNEEVMHQTEKVLNTILSRLNELQNRRSVSNLSSPTGGQGAVVVSLPGVPNEMKGLMENAVLPKLKEHFQLPVILHRTALVVGKGESEVAEMILDFEDGLPTHVKLAYLPSYGMLRLRLTAKGEDTQTLENEIDNLFTQLKTLVKDFLAADEDITLQEVVINLLKEKNKTVATAESCTGGYIAHLITSIAGSSSVYNGSVVSYANSAKENILRVQSPTLQQYGAVSEETVTEMVKGILQAMGTDYALATSGIMGPGGGTTEKPVGLVWIAVGNKNEIKTYKINYPFERNRNIQFTAMTALNLLRRFIIEQESDQKTD